ncbi:hypothetical protein R1flu_020658 [Riccia fluitans]|uniref:Uncharacterized protein n=1 Tax=Riccia fluitans TaxID=41844 RepID=A0ABD1ZM45_9MARC
MVLRARGTSPLLACFPKRAANSDQGLWVRQPPSTTPREKRVFNSIRFHPSASFMLGFNLKLEPWGKDDQSTEESLPQVPGASNDKPPGGWQGAGSPVSGGQDHEEIPSPRARSPNLHKRMILANRDKDLKTGLKVRLGDLQATCDLQHDELCALRRDIRVTRTREVEVERDIYAGEIGRLQKVVRRLKVMSARITAENRELQRLKDKAARLDIANQRLETCIAVVHKTLERANKEVTGYRAKANESQVEAKKYNKRIKELQEHAAVLEGLLEKERIEKRRIGQNIKAVGDKKREWDKEYQAKQRKNLLTASDSLKKKKKKKKKPKPKPKEGASSGADTSGTDAGASSPGSSSDSESPRQLSYDEFEARKLSFLSKVETASHSFTTKEKEVYGGALNRSVSGGAPGSHGYGSGGPYGGASGEFDSAFGPGAPPGSHGRGGHGGPGEYGSGPGGGRGSYGPGGGSGSYGRGGSREGHGAGVQGEYGSGPGGDTGSYGHGGSGEGYGVGGQYSSEGEAGSVGGSFKGGKEAKGGKTRKGTKGGKGGKAGPDSGASSTSEYGSSGGMRPSASSTLSTPSDSSLLLFPDDKKREQDLEGTFYEGMDSAAEEFVESVEAMVSGSGKVPKLNLERMKAKEAAEAKRKEEQRLAREREERYYFQEQEAKRLAAELAEERRLSAVKVEQETQRRLKQIAEQGGLDLEIDHELLRRDEYESEIKSDARGRLSLQINLKRSSEHPYSGSPRPLAEAEVEAEREKLGREVEAQREEAQRLREEIEAREEAVRRAEIEAQTRQEEERRKSLAKHKDEAAHEEELRKKAEDEVKMQLAQEAAAKKAAEEAARVSAWVAQLTPEQLEEFRMRVAAGEDPVAVMKSMQLAAKIKAWEATLTPDQLEEYRRRVAAGEDPAEVMKAMQLAAKIKAWEASLTPEQQEEFRRRVEAGEIPEDVMKMMQWEATLTPEQLAEFRRRVANGEDPTEVMKSIQLSAFEASLTPEELVEYQRRVAAGEAAYAVMEAMIARKKRLNPFSFLDKDMQGFIKENIRGVLGHLENITEVIVHKQEELGMHKEAATTAAAAAMDVLKASDKESEKKRKKKREVHIEEHGESSTVSLEECRTAWWRAHIRQDKGTDRHLSLQDRYRQIMVITAQGGMLFVRVSAEIDVHLLGFSVQTSSGDSERVLLT